MTDRRAIIVIQQGAKDVTMRRDKLHLLEKREQTLLELKKVKDELLTLARRVDKTISELEAA